MRDDLKYLVFLGGILFAFLKPITLANAFYHNDDNRDLRKLDEPICGTPEPSEEAANKSDDVVRKWQQTGDTRRLTIEPIIIPTYFHIINHNFSEIISSVDVQNQLDVANEAYSPYFRFELIDSTHTINESWFSDKRYDREMKKELRRGGCDALNVYVNSGGGYLGYSNFPEECARNFHDDGAVINYGTIPGGEIDGYNHGHTLTHEVGHWLGLYHTFHGGCKGKGDHVGDTPAHEMNDSCADKSQDSCNNKEGMDPLSNFMNYTPDECMDMFTAGQFERMISHWKEYRAGVDEPTPSPTGQVSCKKGQFKLTANILTDNYGGDTIFRLQHRKNSKKGWKNIIMINNFENNANVTVHKCVSKKHCYRYRVTDDYGDGMCCDHGNGGFTVSLGAKSVTSKFLNGKQDIGRIGKKCPKKKKGNNKNNNK